MKGAHPPYLCPGSGLYEKVLKKIYSSVLFFVLIGHHIISPKNSEKIIRSPLIDDKSMY
jgi:hypothetical protein